MDNAQKILCQARDKLQAAAIELSSSETLLASVSHQAVEDVSKARKKLNVALRCLDTSITHSKRPHGKRNHNG